MAWVYYCIYDKRAWQWLIDKIRAYELQDTGLDTVEANEHLGFDADLREYGMCHFMLSHLGVENVKLMTNNPKKVKALTDLGINVVERKPIDHGMTEDNKITSKPKRKSSDSNSTRSCSSKSIIGLNNPLLLARNALAVGSILKCNEGSMSSTSIAATHHCCRLNQPLHETLI